MSSISITLPDGSTREVPAGTPVREFAATALPASLSRKALAATVDGRMVDLSHALERDATLTLVLPEGPEALALYRHSTAHLLAAAVTALFPGAQCGIGPATEDGFFYDFVVDHPFVPDDLERIEKKMRALAQQDLPYAREMWPRDEAMAFFRDRGEPLKVQLIQEKTEGQSHVSCYLARRSSISVSARTCRPPAG
jgi:threonyl-tRNA synthetase